MLSFFMFHADLDAGEVDVPMMPTEEEIRQAQEECARMGADEYYRDAALYDTEEQTAAADGSQGAGKLPLPFFVFCVLSVHPLHPFKLMNCRKFIIISSFQAYFSCLYFCSGAVFCRCHRGGYAPNTAVFRHGHPEHTEHQHSGLRQEGQAGQETQA